MQQKEKYEYEPKSIVKYYSILMNVLYITCKKCNCDAFSEPKKCIAIP